jgi:hypothetical protein
MRGVKYIKNTEVCLENTNKEFLLILLHKINEEELKEKVTLK